MGALFSKREVRLLMVGLDASGWFAKACILADL
jgi:hypothetical protein